MPRRDLAINIGLLCATLFIVIGGAEFGLRVTGIEKGRVVPPPLYRQHPDPDISYELKPQMRERAFRSTVTTNALGFRSPERDPKTPLLSVLGDSITFGYGVEDGETLPARLQTFLPEFQVMNAGVPGYTIVQERATWENKLKALDPAALVLVFYWNDMTDFVPAELAPDGNLYARGQAPAAHVCTPITEGLMGMIPGKCWLDTHSAIYRVLKKLILQKTMQRDLAEQREQYGEDLSYEYITEDGFTRYVSEFNRLADAIPSGTKKYFVIWPDKSLHHTLRPRLKSAAESKGFLVIDLYDTFGNRAETLSWDTVHPSAGTLNTAAHVLGETLQEIL